MKKNTGLKVLAMVIAMILWAYVRVTVGGYSQNIMSQLELQVPLELRGGNSNLIPYESSADTVSLIVRGSADVVGELREGLVRAYVDIESMVAGSHWPEVQVLVPPGVQILAKTPGSVNVKLSSPMVKEAQVSVETAGSPRTGFQVGEPVFNPRSVKLQGPEALVAQVRRVTAVVPVDGLEQSVTLAVSNLIPENENGTAVMGTDNTIRVTPREVVATIPIYREETIRPVSVGFGNVRIEQREGFTYELEASPERVSLRLDDEQDRPLPKEVLTVSVFFPISDEPQERTVPLIKPEGFSLTEPDAVTIRLTAKPKAQSPASRGAGRRTDKP